LTFFVIFPNDKKKKKKKKKRFAPHPQIRAKIGLIRNPKKTSGSKTLTKTIETN
jgi:hypothetical protein